MLAVLAAAGLIAGMGPMIAHSQEAQAAWLRHFALSSSVPAADASVSGALAEVRLVFTETPQLEATTIRLADQSNELVTSTPPTADGEDPRQIYIRPQAAWGAGHYTVHWRSIAQDGHTVNGDFRFEITAE
jgi:methionine-rich copper-binding protein CopC